MGMLIETVIHREAERNAQMISQYEALLSVLPKGSIVCRKKEYFYLKYRENGKVHDKYLGKESSKIEEIREKLAQRKHCEEMLTALQQEKKAIQKILEGFA